MRTDGPIESDDPASRKMGTQVIEGATVTKTELKYRPIQLLHPFANVIENIALCRHAADEAVETTHKIPCP